MSEPLTPAHQLHDALVDVRQAHVDPDGRACDYAALGASEHARRLEAALAALAEFDPRLLPIPEPIAFWLNAYNAVALMTARACGPGEPINGIEGFFDQRRLRVAGQGFSLDDIEHGLLRGNAPKYGRQSGPLEREDPRLAFTPRLYDERVHFAMFSACRSSAPLRVFGPDALAHQLEDAVRECVAREVEIAVDGASITVPRLFKWYQEDFGGEGGVVRFVLARIDDDAVIERVDAHRGDVRVRYKAFDWTLNQRA